MAGKGEAVILVRDETSPEDIHGMHAARGILTARGGMTSHAAVVARGMGRPCVSGAGEIRIDHKEGEFRDMLESLRDIPIVGDVRGGEGGRPRPAVQLDRHRGVGELLLPPRLGHGRAESVRSPTGSGRRCTVRRT